MICGQRDHAAIYLLVWLAIKWYSRGTRSVCIRVLACRVHATVKRCLAGVQSVVDSDEARLDQFSGTEHRTQFTQKQSADLSEPVPRRLDQRSIGCLYATFGR